MIKTKRLLHFFVVYFLLSVGSFAGFAQSSSVSFSFSLAAGARTSAGVFMKDGTLVKTLWSGVNYSSGTHTASWDGTDDQGNVTAANSYDIRVLSNNVAYTWEGVIGNTSAAQSGNTVLHSFQNIFAMAISGSTAYYATNYNENTTATFKLSTSSVQSKTAFDVPGGPAVINFVATDNTNVYWAGTDGFNLATNFVYATREIDDQQVSFSNGQSVNITYRSSPLRNCIDASSNANATITGLAVQKTGNFLFVSHQKLNQLNVFNKITGALIKSVSINAPSSLAIDANDNLWIASGSSVIKYGINADGSLKTASVTLSAFASPLAIAVSPDNNTVVIADGGNSQQLKAFNNNNGAATWTYGQAGGYATDATVTNDKFYFSDLNGINRSFLTFAPDGTFWVGDPGNNRSLHLDANRNYLTQIMYMPHSYGCTVDPNNPTRAFADYLEFKIDYSKSLNPNNGSWTLVKNWGYNVTSAYQDQSRLRTVVTLSNGRTYGLIRHGYVWAVVELVSNGGLRITGINTPNLDYQIYPDGSLKTGLSLNSLGASSTFLSQPLVGFDGSNNPQWGQATTIASSPPATINDPLYTAGNSTITSSNIAVAFDGGLPPSPLGSAGFHLGGIKLGTNKWLWRTAPVTFKGYNGPFPLDGTYDIGNGVQYGGSLVMTLDRTVIWGYHGEFWKNSQTNKWNQVYDDGLLVGQFGITGPETNGVEAAASMAGNALSAAIVKDANGNAYLYHCDESYHGGLHRWKITGLNTIQEQTIPVVWSDSSHGLLGEYMDGTDLNNLNTKTIRTDQQINFSWGSGIPSGTQISSSSNFSVRWSGYVKPVYSENYTFNFNSGNKIRLWINDSLLLDQWNNGTQKSFNSTPIALKAGVSYAIVIEYSNATAGGGAIESLSWSSPSQSLQVIPTGNLYPAQLPDTANGLDLMRDLHFRKILVNNLYGWSRTPAQEDISSAKFTKWWSAQTGFQSVYSPTGSPDVGASFTQVSNVYTVTRDLGTYTGNLNSWKLSGVVNYLASNLNFGTGGMYLEVLDVSGKVITRFQVTSSFGSNPVVTVIGNSSNIAVGTTGVMNPVVFQNQPITISYGNGKATFQYAGYAPVSVPIFDATGNGLQPKTMRLYFFQNGAPYYNREIDLVSMRFSPNGVVATPPLNQPPVAITGAAQTITFPVSGATLDGTKSYDTDGSVVGYNWVLVTGTGGIITTPAGSTTTVTGLTPGTYIYKLTVTDNSGATASALDTVVVNTVSNLPPIANAGTNQTIILPTSSVSLDGSASRDQDNGGLISSWSWSQSSGPSASNISSPSTATTAITGLQAGVYVFKLQVTDANGAKAYDSVLVTVNPAAANLPPIANAGADQTTTLPTSTVSLDGSASKDQDNGGLISSWSWSQSSGPSGTTITSSSTAATTITGLQAGVYVFKLQVTDANGATAYDSVIVTVNAAANQPPVANAGSSKSITLPLNSVTLDGSLSTDPDGTIVSYSWAQVSGPSSSSLTNAATVTATANNLIAGQYIFELTVTDNGGAVTKAQVKITVVSAGLQPPVANAGANQTITLPVNQVNMDGSASVAPSGNITSYNWSEISGPSSATLTTANAATTNANNLVAGTYIFKLTVQDNNNATDGDSVTITVKPAANVPPVANAGNNITIVLPTNTATLDGSKSSDADGTISSYSWNQVSGPNNPGITGANTATLQLNGLIVGQYDYQLQVTDNNGAISSANVKVIVVAAQNVLPIANAGPDQAITAPTSSVNLNGAGSNDPDGLITAYSWTFISGPGSVTITNGNTANPTVTGLIPGIYTIQLKVTDNNGANATDRMVITVNPNPVSPNQPPVANAGNNATVTEPVNTIQLNGDGSFDPDGAIVNFAWSQVSGPNSATIGNNGTGTPTVSNLVVGSYVFQLMVTDNNGATSTAQVKVIVVAQQNVLPIANAGPDQTITAPTTSVSLNGTGSSDPNGTITAYSWTLVSGLGSVTINNGNTANPSVTGLTPGTYTIQLKVTDNNGASATDQVVITVNPNPTQPNQAPVANAGNNASITEPVNSLQLNGTSSFDPDGAIVNFVWSQVSGPNTATISSNGTGTPTVSNLIVGSYVFQLMVTDNNGATNIDQVTITVNQGIATTNLAPIALAGADTTIQLPASTYLLNAGASYDPDGNITSYQWQEITGPSTVLQEPVNAPGVDLTNLQAGVYEFQVVVTDNDGATSASKIKITVDKNIGAGDQLIIYPNPATDVVYGKLTSTITGTVQATVYDMNGRLVYRDQSEKTADVLDKTMNISNLASGMYTIVLNIANRKTMIAKFIKL